LKHHPGSELGALEVEFGPHPWENPTGKAQQITTKEKHNTISTKDQRGPPRGQGTIRNPNFAHFALIFLIFFPILYLSNRKHNNFQLNWKEDMAYRNSTILA
jgi:hypothetical protein